MATTLMEQAIKLQLKSDTTVTGLVGDRIEYNKAPQDWTGTTTNPKPYIVIFRIAGVREYAFDNVSTLVDATFQVSIYAETFSAVSQTAEAVRKELYNLTPLDTLGGAGGFSIGGVYLENETDLFDREIEPPRHHRALTFRIPYYESRS